MFTFHPLAADTRSPADRRGDRSRRPRRPRSGGAATRTCSAESTSRRRRRSLPASAASPRSAHAADGVVAGFPVACAVIDTVCGDAASDWEYLVDDGDRGEAGAGRRPCDRHRHGLLLTAERTALNLLCHLSGVATLTRRWAEALHGTPATVRDTRKTTPGLRVLEKYAVRCGGGANHRMGLSDMALVKDNHVVAAGGVAEAYRLVKSLEASIPVEIEVDSARRARRGDRRRRRRGAARQLRPRPDARGRRLPRRTRARGAARGERRAHAGGRPRRRRDRRRLHRRRRAHPLGPQSSTSAWIFTRSSARREAARCAFRARRLRCALAPHPAPVVPRDRHPYVPLAERSVTAVAAAGWRPRCRGGRELGG